jgi:biotin operon repressor
MFKISTNPMSKNVLQKDLENASQSDRKIVKSFLESPQDLKENVSAIIRTSKHDPEIIGVFARVTKKLNLVNSTLVNSVLANSAQSSDFDKLLCLLNHPDFLADASKDDPLAAAKLKGVELKHDLLKETLSSEAIAKLLEISRQAVDKRRRNGKLLAFSQGRRGYAYPSWQIENGQVILGLDEVIRSLSEYSEWTQAMFLTTGDMRLQGQTPLEYLRLGKIQEVLTAAKLYGEHSAA